MVAAGTLSNAGSPVAKALIQAAYGKRPERSYMGGSSNGGRHTMAEAARDADHYDGYLAGSPGFNATEHKMVVSAILARCDALDGVQGRLVDDVEACRSELTCSAMCPLAAVSEMAAA